MSFLRHPLWGEFGHLNALLLASSTGGSGSFTIPTTPTSSTADKIPLAPNWTAGPTGLDSYRPWRVTVIDGDFYLANGWDTPRRWDRTNAAWAYVGSAAPATFGLALSAAGSPAAIPTGQTPRYYLVGYNSTTGKETAPQGGGDVTIANSSGGTRDVTVTWTASEFAAEFDKVRIYRALNLTDDYKLVNGLSGTAVGTATYLDVTPDATLRALAIAYTWAGARRTTLPPSFAGIIESQGKAWAWENNSDVLWYTFPIKVTGTPTVEDFIEGNWLQIGADEGTGAPTALADFQRSTIVWKRKAIYEFTGTDAVTADIRTLTTARGTFNLKTVVAVDRWFLCLDEAGIYKFTPGLYAGTLGSTEEMYLAPMQPIFDRMNFSASSLFHATHLPATATVVFWVALDFDPVPEHGIVFDYGAGKFMGLITRRKSTAFGYLRDALGFRHPCFGNDMGYLMEDLYAESEGCFSGDNTATVTSGAASTRLLTASAAAFTTTLQGATGTPMRRYSTSGAVLDENWVYSLSGTALTTYLYPSAAVTAGDSVAVGVIPAVLETAQFSFDTHEKKDVRDVYLEFASGVSGSVAIDVALNDDAWIRKWEQSLLTVTRTNVPVANVTNRNHGQCWSFRLRLSQEYANLGFSMRAIHIHFNTIEGAKT